MKVISHNLIGTRLPERSIEVERYSLRFFAEAIGATDPLHTDEAVARAAGYRSLLAPPTYVCCLANMADPDSGALLSLLDVDLRKVLHGEQRITYYEPICAGDRLRFASRIADIYSKKAGALEFVAVDTTVINQDNLRVAATQTLIVVRHAS